MRFIPSAALNIEVARSTRPRVELISAGTFSFKKFLKEFALDGAETLSFERIVWLSASDYDCNSTTASAAF